VDAAQNIIVKEDDCHTLHYKTVHREVQGGFSESFEDRIYGKTLASDVKNASGETILQSGTTIDKKILEVLNEHKIQDVNIRSVLTCDTEG
jgi:DNA-directed RNA polymerase subunit beta'